MRDKKIQILTQIFQELPKEQLQDLISKVTAKKFELNREADDENNKGTFFDDTAFFAVAASVMDGSGTAGQLARVLLNLISSIDTKPSPIPPDPKTTK